MLLVHGIISVHGDSSVPSPRGLPHVSALSRPLLWTACRGAVLRTVSPGIRNHEPTHREPSVLGTTPFPFRTGRLLILSPVIAGGGGNNLLDITGTVGNRGGSGAVQSPRTAQKTDRLSALCLRSTCTVLSACRRGQSALHLLRFLESFTEPLYVNIAPQELEDQCHCLLDTPALPLS